VPIQPQIAAVAIRVARASQAYPHTYGLFCVLRQPTPEANWWGEWLARSEIRKPEQVKTGGWGLFRFDPPVPVKPGKQYILTVYNADCEANPVRLKAGLQGDHRWPLNVGPPDYPRGNLEGLPLEDLACVVYATQPSAQPGDDG
jgi:hypothetical protein